MAWQALEIVAQWYGASFDEPGVFQRLLDKHDIPEEVRYWTCQYVGRTCSQCFHKVHSAQLLHRLAFRLLPHYFRHFASEMNYIDAAMASKLFADQLCRVWKEP